MEYWSGDRRSIRRDSIRNRGKNRKRSREFGSSLFRTSVPPRRATASTSSPFARATPSSDPKPEKCMSA